MGNVTFLGVEGSGKTVLTMALVNAFRAHEAEGWRLRPETRGAFRFLAQVPDVIAGETLPHQTTSLRQLAWSVLFRDEPQRTLDILDYPGEVYRLAFLEAADDPNPASFAERVAANKEEIDALLGHLLCSEQVFVLFNLADAFDLANKPANLDAVWTTNACLDYLHRLPSHPRITLLLTQIDRYVSFDSPTLDPAALVSRHLPLIAKNFPKLDVLAIAALGDADSIFGLDNLLARCLIDTPTVQQTLTAIKSTHTLFGQELIAFCKQPGLKERDALDTAFKRYQSNATHLSTHWFLSRTMLEQSGKLLSEKDLEDFHALRKRLRLVAVTLPAGQYAQSIEAMIGTIRAVRPQGAVGRQWQETIIAHLTELVANIRREQAIDRQWMFAAWGIGVMMIMSWIFVLIYA